MNLNKIAWAWGSIWYYAKVAKRNWVDVLLIAALAWMLLHGLWVMVAASVQLAAMGL